MNKSTLPVAVILAAASVPAQAQDAVANYTKAQLLEECNLAITEVGEYPDAVRSKYVDKLGSAELISCNRQRVADVPPHSDEVDKKTP